VISKGTFCAALLAVLCMGTAFIGCSDDKSTTTATTDVAVALSDFNDLTAAVAPGVFDGVSGAPLRAPLAPPDTSLGCWTDGNGALLRLGFGSQAPMALHRNTYRFQQTVAWLNRVHRLGDTTFTGVVTDSASFSGTMTVTRLQQSVGIPEVCQTVLGDTALSLRYHVRVQLNEQTQTRLEAAFGQDDTCELILAYGGYPAPDSAHPDAYEHCLTYAYRHRTQDSFQIRAVAFKEYRNAESECAMWSYQIASRNQNQFFYRLAWFADDFGDSAGVGSLIGAGHNQTQFALRYQQMVPEDLPLPDTLDPHGHLYRLFGPNYTDQGLTLGTSLDGATDPALMYRYAHLPVALRLTPTQAAMVMNPWYQE
jgi:hypothetical protein